MQLRAAAPQSNLCFCGVTEAVAQSAVPLPVDTAGRGSYIHKRASDWRGSPSNLLFDDHSHHTIYSKVIFTIPLRFNTGEEVHTAEAQGVSRNQGYIHLHSQDRKRRNRNEYVKHILKCNTLVKPDSCVLTVKRTKNLWFFSPTQLLTQGQWWSIFLMHLLQILHRGEKTLPLFMILTPDLPTNVAVWRLQGCFMVGL